MDIFLPTLYAFIASFAFMIVFEVKGKALIPGSLGGALSQMVYTILLRIDGINFILPFFVAAIFLTFYSEIMARVMKKPATVFIIPALFPLVPGSNIYQTMVYFVEGRLNLFFVSLQETLVITGALALGIIIVSAIFRNASKNPHINNKNIVK